MKRIRKVGLTNFILLVSSLILVIILIGFSFMQNADSADEIAESWKVKNNIDQISSTISKMESFGLTYRYTNNIKYKEEFRLAEKEYDTLLKSLRYLVRETEQQVNRVNTIEDKMDANLKLLDSILLNPTSNLSSIENDNHRDVHFNDDVALILKDMLITADVILDKRIRKFTTWKLIILAGLGIATIIVFLSLFNLIKKIRPLIEELLQTQSDLERSNKNLQHTLKDLKISNAEKQKEIKAKEKAIEEADKLNESLIVKNQQLDHFAYVASHDLQEPLRTVSNYLEIFQEDFPERVEGEAVMYFNFINKAVERMRNLISGLLSFSRIGTSGQMEEVNLNETLEKIKDDFAVVIEERGIVIEHDHLPTITGYRIEIKQLFQNLISNAIKFTKPEVKPNIKISFDETDNYFNFHIKDNGIGIPEKDFTKVFDMFSRLNSNKDYEGQGIGLAFCQKIVELHLGNIWVSSTFGVGTTVHFTLKK